jgi:hypothetical protein
VFKAEEQELYVLEAKGLYDSGLPDLLAGGPLPSRIDTNRVTQTPTCEPCPTPGVLSEEPWRVGWVSSRRSSKEDEGGGGQDYDAGYD